MKLPTLCERKQLWEHFALTGGSVSWHCTGSATHYTNIHTFHFIQFFAPSRTNLHIFLSDRLEKTAGSREASHATDLTPFQEPSSKVSGITPRYLCRRRRRSCINPFECACESAASLMCHLAKQTCQSRNLRAKFTPMLRREQKQS